MLRTLLLSELIQQKIPLGSEGASGWHAIRCMVCNDHSPRGAFRFDDDKTGYNCFNCGARFAYTEGKGNLSNAAKEILEKFGISREDLRRITSTLFTPKTDVENITLDDIKRPKLFTPEVAFPDRCYALLSTEHEDIQEPILEYLLNRNIDPSRTKFYFSLNPKFARRVIIPYWRDGKLIYWQARHIDSGVKPRYMNCTVAKDAVLYGYDRLTDYDESPLFVTEGVFDAILVNGIAIMSADLNASKIEILKRTRRRLIFIRDRDARGDKLSQIVINNGWEITTVDKRAGDVNDSINRFGAAYTALSLIRNAQKPENRISTSINLGLWGLEDRLKNR